MDHQVGLVGIDSLDQGSIKGFTVGIGLVVEAAGGDAGVAGDPFHRCTLAHGSEDEDMSVSSEGAASAGFFSSSFKPAKIKMTAAAIPTIVVISML